MEKNLDNKNTNSSDKLQSIEFKLENKEIKVKEVKEGKVNIQQTNDSGTFSPFYNPAQELNRDISVVTIASYMELTLEEKKLKEEKKQNKNKSDETRKYEDYKFTLVDVMSATGLRAVRYLKELNHVDKIIANDLDAKAVELIKVNAELNGDTESKIEIHQKDAAELMYTKMKYFDIVDLDPYGTAIPLIDSAVQACKNNGLVLATFTDMQVLCGCYTETCYYKYGSIPYKKPYCHEVSFLLNNILDG
jgi:tRNA (guanine26-N2/guanine27-N2)-dimethyltransferase